MSESNVVFLPGRYRCDVVHESPTWCYHRMKAGSALNGKAPATLSKTAGELDPAISAGMVVFSDLSNGGLFTLQESAKLPLVIEAIDNPASATVTIISRADPSRSRVLPTAPFKLAPGEIISATGGTAGSFIGIMYRMDCQKVF